MRVQKSVVSRFSSKILDLNNPENPPGFPVPGMIPLVLNDSKSNWTVLGVTNM